MYCKHCGQKIDENSKFCQHCGKSQDNSNKSLTNKPVWIIYLIWALSNLYLLMGTKEKYASSYFYPCTRHEEIRGYRHFLFETWDKTFYDYSEFIIYVFVIPAILYVIYRRFNKQIDKFVNKIDTEK